MGTRKATNIARCVLFFAFANFSGCTMGSSVVDQGTKKPVVTQCVGITPPQSMYLPPPVVVLDAGIDDASASDASTTETQESQDVVVDATPQDAQPARRDVEEDTADATAEIEMSPDSESIAQDTVQDTEQMAEVSSMPADADDATNSGDATLAATDTLDTSDTTALSTDSGTIQIPRIDTCAISPGTCIGEAAPDWALYDFQPTSCGYKATYGLPQFVGHVTVVALLAAW